MVLLPSFLIHVFPYPQRLYGAWTDWRGRYPYLETDVRSKAFQPQCNTAVGASRDSQDSRTSKNQKEWCAGFQLSASEQLGQDRDAHFEVLCQTMYRTAGRHTFHQEWSISSRRDRWATRKHQVTTKDRTDFARRVSEWCISLFSIRFHYRLEYSKFRATLYS